MRGRQPLRWSRRQDRARDSHGDTARTHRRDTTRDNHRNPAELADAPKRRPLASAEQRAWNAQQLKEFLDLAADHRLFATFWLAANTGMRRGELLGLR